MLEDMKTSKENNKIGNSTELSAEDLYYHFNKQSQQTVKNAQSH